MAMPGAACPITAPRLSAFGWTDPTKWEACLRASLLNHGMVRPREVAHLLTQLAVETAFGKQLEENLNYSAKALMRLWPKRFSSLNAAKACAGAPQKIANLVYANRLGNEGPETGDGYRYRGRGLIQITGKDNYRLASPWVGQDLVAQPDLAAHPDLATEIAVRWWQGHGAQKILAQTPDDLVACARLRALINGGINGLDKARATLPTAIKIFT